MYDPVWEAVARLELCGFRIMALVCDRLAANRKLFRLHNPVTKPTDINQQSKNPYADDGRCLHFICDPLHLIKCVRNAWSNSKRLLWVICLLLTCMDFLNSFATVQRKGDTLEPPY